MIIRKSTISSVFIAALTILFMGIAVTVAFEGDLLSGKMNEAVLKALKKEVPGDVRLYCLRVVTGAHLLKEGESFEVVRIGLGRYSGKNRINYSVTFRLQNGEERDVLLEASYDVLVDVYITSRSLLRGTVLSRDDFNIFKQRVSRLPAGAILKAEDLEGKILKTNLSSGIILRTNYVTSDLPVKRGQTVEVHVEGDNVLLTIKGVLRNNAVIGGVARVLCDVSKKEISGILISPDTVEVKI
jgi:flagella basal body P-ring formation protein FlgA